MQILKKQLKERSIKFQTPYPAKLKVHLREGIKTYNSAWEAVEGLLPLGIKTTISEGEQVDKELHLAERVTAAQRNEPDPQSHTSCGGFAEG